MISENSIFKSGGQKYFKDYSRKVKALPKEEMHILPIEVDTPKKKSLYEKMKDYDFKQLGKIALSATGMIASIALLILGLKYSINNKKQLRALLSNPDEITHPSLRSNQVNYQRNILENALPLPPRLAPSSFQQFDPNSATAYFGPPRGNGMCGGNVFSDVYSKVKNMDSSTKKKLLGTVGLAGFIANALLNKNHKAPHGVPLFEGFGKKENSKLFKTYEKKKIPVIDEEKATDEEVATTWDKVKTFGEQTLLQLAIAGIGLASTIATVLLQHKIYKALGIPVEEISLEPIKLDVPKFGDGGQQYRDYSKLNKTLPNPILPPPEINTPKKKSLWEKMKNYDLNTLKKIAGGVGIVASVALLILGAKYFKNRYSFEPTRPQDMAMSDINDLISELEQDPQYRQILPQIEAPSTPPFSRQGRRLLHEPAFESSYYEPSIPSRRRF
jgi:hypothetical protein